MFIVLMACGQPPSPMVSPSAPQPAEPARVDPAEQVVPAANPVKNNAITDWLIVPGVSAGPIRVSTDDKALKILFSDAVACDAGIGEGFTLPATCINKGSKTEAEVVWADKARTRVGQVRIIGTAWRTAEGIGEGSTLAEIEAVLGTFQLAGYGWDYSGAVSLEGTRWDGMLAMSMQLSSQDPDHLSQIQGDKLFSSDNPHLRALAPSVTRLIVLLSEVEVEPREFQ